MPDRLVASTLAAAGLLCVLLGAGSGLEAQPTASPASPPTSPDVVVDDWQAGTLGQLGVPPGWEGQTWGKPSAFALGIVVDDGQRVLHLESRNDRATITRDLRGGVSLARTPILRWRWKVVAMPTGGDARQRQTSDQAAQIYVTWSRPPALLHSRIIGYAWDTTAPAARMSTSGRT